jgi:hypothetical protein
MRNFEQVGVMEERWVRMKKFLNNPKQRVAEFLEVSRLVIPRKYACALLVERCDVKPYDEVLSLGPESRLQSLF